MAEIVTILGSLSILKGVESLSIIYFHHRGKDRLDPVGTNKACLTSVKNIALKKIETDLIYCIGEDRD